MQEKIAPSLADLAVELGSVKLHPRNPRRGDVPEIKKSLKRFGQYKTITVQKSTGLILAGNHTWKAARELGWKKIAAAFVDLPDDEATALVLADNGTADLAVYDEAELAAMVADVRDPNLIPGFSQDRVENLIYGVNQEPAPAPANVDDVPDLPKREPQTRLGDVWVFGEHRLVCGKAEDPLAVEAVMGADKAALMWTDPPYGVDYEGKTEEKLRIKGDGKDGLARLLRESFANVADYLAPGAPVYVAHADTERVTFETALRENGYLVRQNLIWVKNTMVLGHSDYHYRHEPILEAVLDDDGEVDGKEHEPVLYGFAAGGEGRLGRGGPRWYGTNNRTTVFEFPKPAASRSHPTMKPVELIQAMLVNSVRPGRLILDPFAGSGSTMLAAELQGCASRLIELDPRYCDVILARWHEQGDGSVAVRESDGAEFEGIVDDG